MINLLRKAEKGSPINVSTFKPDFTPINASVSIIFRLFIRNNEKRPENIKMIEKQLKFNNDHEPLHLSTDELNKYFMNQDKFDPENVEVQILYIKRGDNDQDRFSGHVAFPGGKQENDESLLNAAVRETQEEVGLDLLDKTKFAFICQYPLTWPFFFLSRRRRMFVSPFIFVQLTFDDLELTYQEKEVQSSIWTSLEFLADNDDRFFWFRPQK